MTFISREAPGCWMQKCTIYGEMLLTGTAHTQQARGLIIKFFSKPWFQKCWKLRGSPARRLVSRKITAAAAWEI